MDTYEKKYNEALERANAAIDIAADKDLVKGVATTIFPELHESEDERIRKNLVDAFTEYKKSGGVDFHGIEINTLLSWLEKQKEPTTEELYAEAGTTEKEYIANTMKMVRAMRERKKEQKPISQEDFDTAKHEALWDEQKPAWSEKDEKMWMDIKSHMIHGSFIPFDKIEWIENRLKSIRPSWKPSEEHLSALLAVFNDPDNIGSQTCQLALTDLYEHLKKL